MPEVRSPQLSKASVAQLSGISTKSWAALCRDHTSSASQLHPAHSGPSPLIGPSSPALTPFSERSWDPASALAGRGGALEWEGQERSEAPLVNSSTHRNLGIPWYTTEQRRQTQKASLAKPYGSAQGSLGLELPCL